MTEEEIKDYHLKMLHNLGQHLISNMEADIRKKFAAWNSFVNETKAEGGVVGATEKPPHIPIEMQVVTMQKADGPVYDTVSLDDIPTDGGVPMKVEVSKPYFIEFKNAVLPENGEPEFTTKTQMTGLMKAIMSEHANSVGFLHVAESWVWRGDLSEYVPYEEDPEAGPREEALVVTFQMINGGVMTGVMPIGEENGVRYLKALEFGTPFNRNHPSMN